MFLLFLNGFYGGVDIDNQNTAPEVILDVHLDLSAHRSFLLFFFTAFRHDIPSGEIDNCPEPHTVLTGFHKLPEQIRTFVNIADHHADNARDTVRDRITVFPIHEFPAVSQMHILRMFRDHADQRIIDYFTSP